MLSKDVCGAHTQFRYKTFRQTGSVTSGGNCDWVVGKESIVAMFGQSLPALPPTLASSILILILILNSSFLKLIFVAILIFINSLLLTSSHKKSQYLEKATP